MTWTEKLDNAQRVLGNLHAHCTTLERIAAEAPQDEVARRTLRTEIAEEVHVLKGVLHDVEEALKSV